MSLATAIEKVFNKCNLIGEDADVWATMMQYKAIRNLDEQEQENTYNDLVDRLGFTW